MKTLYVDRSRRVAFERCPCLRYWQYEYGSRGLQSTKTPIAYHTGIVVHDALEGLLRGDELEVTVNTAKTRYIGAPTLDFAGYGSTPAADVLEEQQAMAEALARAFQLARLPDLCALGTLVSIEQEEQAVLYKDVEVELRLLVRSDLLVRHHDGLLYIHNLKTVASPDDRWKEQWVHDTATLAEVLAVEARVGESLGGVVIEGICKGRKTTYRGRTYHDSPLLWAWQKKGIEPFPDEWTTHYEWKDETGNHTLGKGWTKQPTWKAYLGGLPAWIRWLWQNDPETVKQQFIVLPAILRSSADIEEWKASTIHEELQLYEANTCSTAAYRLIEPGTRSLASVSNFAGFYAKHSDDGNCTFPTRCPAYELCWGVASVDPLNTGFRWRVPNHDREVLDEQDRRP